MLRRSLFPRVAFAALAGLAAALTAQAASAQSLALAGGVSYPFHLNADGSSRALRDISLNPEWVSYQDCEDGEILQFPLLLSGWTGADLFEIWAGTTDCSQPTARGPAAGGTQYQCWQVYSNSGPSIVAVSETLQINIAVRDILAYVGNPPQDGAYHPNQGNERACHTQVNDTAVTPNIYFMAVNATSYAVDGQAYQYTLTTDLVGPPPPSNPTIALGDTLLVVNWGPIQDPSTIGYDVFMDPLPGAGAVATEAGVPEASTTTQTYCPDSSAPPAVDAATPVDSGDDGASEAGTSTSPVDSGCFTYTINTGNSSTPASSCSSGILSSPPGLPSAATAPVLSDGGSETFFDAGYEAGTSTTSTAGGGNSTIPTNYIVASVNGQTETSATVTGLVDGVTYNVVVAAYDGTGNIGPQTAISCAAPAPINDFWKTYKEAGGGAGGGFCSLDFPGAPVGTGIFALAFGASTLGAVRRWRRKT